MTPLEPTECSSQPAQLQGSCSICFEDLRQSDKISAIICGHIYHHGCISQWIAAKRQCPSCRRTVPKNGFVEKLFFDVQRIGEVEKPAEVDYREEHYKLSTSLKVEKEKMEKLETENKALKSEVKSLERKVTKEKDKYKSEVPKLQATINHLTISSEDTEYIRRELTEAKNKLKASEFYKILTIHSDQAEKQLGDYLRKSGALDTEKFFQLQRAQIRELTEKRRDAAREIESLKTECHSLKKQAKDDSTVINDLKKSVLMLRERANVETPINNKRLREVLETDTPPAVKRISMGFNDSSQLLDEVSFTNNQENNKSGISLPSSSSTAVPTFDYEDDDEYFKTPKLTNKPKKIEKTSSLALDDTFEFDIPVPQSILDRRPVKAAVNVLKLKPNIPNFSRQVSQNKQTDVFDSDHLAYQSWNRKASSKTEVTLKSGEVGKNLKKHPSADSIPKKNVSIPTKTISSFFTKATSSAPKTYVTIED